MTTETTTKCTAEDTWRCEGVAQSMICGAEAKWQTESGEPRCDWHAPGHCRRIGPVEGTED